MIKLIRTATVSISLKILLHGQLKYLNNYFEVVAISSKGTELEDIERDEGVRTIGVSINRKISLIKDALSLIRLYRLFRREKPYIVHSITPKAGLLSMVAAWLAKIPIRIHSYTGLIFPSEYGLYQKLLIYIDRLLCFCATNIYPEGEGVKKDLLKYNITSKPMKVLANGNINGINSSFFDPSCFNTENKNNIRHNLNLNDNDFVFLFVGRLVSDKGINELILSFIEVAQYYSNVKLLLVGPYEHDLDPLNNETIQLINTNKNIISVGFQADVRPYFAISDIFVFPSYREGFPNVVIQAGAMGLPSIVSDINGCNEIIIDGTNGVIVPPKDKNALKEKIKLLIEDTKLREKLKNNARKMIISRYEQQIVWGALLKEYQTLLKRKGISCA